MDVDPATVSRWECGKLVPSPSTLSRIRQIAIRAEPAHSDAYILSSPTLKYLCRLDDFSAPKLVSKGLLRELGVGLEQVLADISPFWGGDDQRVNDIVQGDPRWLKSEIAFFSSPFIEPLIATGLASGGAQ